MGDIRLGGPVDRDIQAANVARMRAQIRRRERDSYLAQQHGVTQADIDLLNQAAAANDAIALAILRRIRG